MSHILEILSWIGVGIAYAWVGLAVILYCLMFGLLVWFWIKTISAAFDKRG